MLEGFYFTVSYAPVLDVIYLCIIIAIDSSEGFVLGISKTFQNTILKNTEERVYLTLPNLYLEWFKIKHPKHQLP